ncbi:MAG TPA: hypothetical protein ENH91_14695 [Leeuwenhoekiella sp.]|nr:hypothetical protein [Leeuwenhoekiella sp.]
MKNRILTLLVFLTLSACKNNQEKKNSILEKGCYVYDSNGNTVTMEITKVGKVVTGNLDMAYSEKDANTGTFLGTLKGDTLIGTYTFNSEGVKSKREIAFLVKNDQLIEGYGELNDDGTRFNNSKVIAYSSKMPLKKAACSE